MTKQAETFPEESFAKLAAVEEGHFWFEERNNFISWAMRKYAPHCRSESDQHRFTLRQIPAVGNQCKAL